MWIKFKLQGMLFELKIDGYKPHQDIDGEWTKESFLFKFQNIINYKKDNSELLLCCEIDDLIENLKDLLNDKVSEIKEYGCIEPDFEFTFKPKYDVRNDPNCLYVKSGMEVEDIELQLKINLWSGGLTDNYFSTTFCRKEIEQLYFYLLLITNRIKLEDEKIQVLINKGIIYSKI